MSMSEGVEEAVVVDQGYPRGDRGDGINIRLHDNSCDFVNRPVVLLVGLGGRLGAFPSPVSGC